MRKNSNKVLDIKQQTLISSIGIAAQNFAQWLISVLIVRMDGYEAAGVFSLAMSISNVFACFANYGIRAFQITDAKKTYSEKQFLLVRIETGIASVILCTVYLLVAQGYSILEKWAILLYLFYSVAVQIGDIMSGTAQKNNHLEVNGYSCALKGGVSTVTFFVSFYLTKNILLALAMMLLGGWLVVVLYDYRQYCRFGSPKANSFRHDFKKSWNLWRSCFSLAISLVIPLITTAVPRRTIQSMLGTETLGIFSSIFTPTVIISTMAPAIVTAFLPHIAVQWKRGNAVWVRGAMWMGVGLFSVGTVAALGVVRLCGRPIMALLFGEDILNYFSLLYWAVLATVCLTVASFLNGILTAIRHTNCIAFLTAGTMLTTVCLARFMIAQFGIYGVAYLQILVYLIQVILQILLISFFTGVSVESGKKELP